MYMSALRGDTFLWKGYEELKKVLVELRPQVNLKRFLRSFFVYSMGVQTVMVMAVLFAKKEIDWGGDGDSGLIISVLIIQFVAGSWSLPIRQTFF